MEGFCNLIFHRGGVLVSEPEKEYIGREIVVWTKIDIDYVSIPDIEALYQEHWGLGEKYKEVFWLVPGTELKVGLRPLKNDGDVRMIFEAVAKENSEDRDIHFYFVHEAIEANSEDTNHGNESDKNVDAALETPFGEKASNNEDTAYELELDDSYEDEDNDLAFINIELEDVQTEMHFGDAGCSSKSKKKPKWRVYNGRPKNLVLPKIMENVRGIDESANELEEGYDTDEMESLKGSDDEEIDKMPPAFVEGATYGKVHLQLEMLFPNLKIFKDAVKDYTVALGRQVKMVKNDKVRCRIKCIEDCPWEIVYSWCEAYGSYQIKIFNLNHTCSRKLKNPIADRHWVANKLVNRLRSTPNMTAADAYNYMAETYQVQLCEMKLYRAMHIAREKIEGSEKEQYAKLWDYCAELRRSNPGSTLQLGVDRPSIELPPKFDRLYICFDATKKGALSGCRPLIGLDGCFLKGYYGGTLLAAVTQDANQSFYVIAYGIVEQETKDTWTWFLVRLLEDIGHPNTHGWEFISDMQKGLLPAIQDLCPGTSHRFCVKHLEANVWKQWRNKEPRSKLWCCAKSKTMPEFERNYQQLKSINEAAWSYLNKFPPQTWTRAAFRAVSKNWALLNNMCEQFNATIVKFRGKPILTMLEEIRTYLMNKMNNSRSFMARYKGPISPSTQTKLEQAKKNSNFWNPLWAGDEDGSKFQVQHILRFNAKYVVDLKEFTCSCKEWDLTGIPCAHVVACLGHNNLVPEQFVHPYYSKETWENTYRPFILPVRGQDQWEKTQQDPILPPHYNRGGGRPKKQRTKKDDIPENPFKAKRKHGPMRCGKCGSQGHNSRSCQGTCKKQKTCAKEKVQST